MKNSEYWRGRFSILEEAAQKEADHCIESIEEMFREAEITVQGEIEKWYGRFAHNNQISLTEAKKMLTSGQLEEFKWSVEKYIEIGEKAGLSKAWLKKLENASARFHISRLESVQLQIQQQLELLYGNQTDEIDAHLRKITANGYTQSAFEIQKGINIGWDIVKLDKKKLDLLISKPWTMDGKTFRDRCWEGKANLTSNLQKHLVQGLLRGDSSQKITDAVKKEFGISRYKAGRLVRTETTYFNAATSFESYKNLGVDMVEIIETLDSHTCPICRPLDGKLVPMSEFQPGVTVPPFHPNCRGTTAPAIDEEIIGERAARDADGNVYYVPSNMKYGEWEKTFVEGRSKKDLTVVDSVMLFTYDDPIREVLGSAFESHPEETQAIIDNLKKKGVEVIYRKDVMGYEPDPTFGKPGQLVIDKEASYSAWLHEWQHAKDDEDSGWLGFRNFMDISVAIKFEERAYNVEIEFAEKLGYNDIVKRLEMLKEKRIEGLRIHEEY